MGKLTKIERYNILIEEFQKREDRILNIYDETLRVKFGVKPPRIKDYFIEFMNEYNSIVEVEGRRQKTYKLIEPMDLIINTFEHFEDISWLWEMAKDSDPKIFQELEKYTKKSEDIFLFKSNPFEDTKEFESIETFRHLKSAVKNREYRKITFKGGIQDNLKCLKLVYMENNWYIAYVNEQNRVLFGRISFIEKVEYASKTRTFQPSSVEKQLEFLKTIQNAMTLYGKSKQKALLMVQPKKAKYFDEGMKLRLSSQKIEKRLEDGSIILSVEYTQPDEILPLIQGWLPYIVILKPQSLKDEYIKRLQQTMDIHLQ